MLQDFNHDEIAQALKKSYQLFIEYYAKKRDIEALLTLFSPEITNIGSGEDELTLSHTDVITIFKRDMEQCPDPLDYKELNLQVIPLSKNLGLIISICDIDATINEMPVSMKGYRFSMIWEQVSEKWQIRHIHLSKGEPELKKGESFPLSEIEERNKALKELVKQRTMELHTVNIELSEAHKEVNEVKQRFETIFEKASDGIIVADWKDHSFFMVNQKICDILGYRKKDISNFWFSDLIPAADYQESMKKILQESVGDRLIADDIPLRCSNNEIRYFDITSQPIKIKRRNYLVSLYRDITEHKKALQLKHEAEIAQKASEAKNLFLANMSHEIRTPVTGIMGMSEILSKTGLSPQQSEYLRVITDSSKILLTLINDILDISKIEAGKLELKTEKIRIKEVIENIKALSQPGVLQKNNQILISISNDVPEWVFADKMRLEQVIMNLVNNAVKFTENGTISIHVEVENAVKNRYRISVKDTGIGIGEEDMPKLFQKFQQLDSSLSRPADGSGLGLFICKQLVTLMEGEIGVESEQRTGSKFWFTFTSKAPRIPDQTKEEIKNPEHLPLDMNILLVDDKSVNLKVITLMLESAKCKIDTAINGKEALESFDPEKHEMILMDIMMPVMDGVTAMKELRKKYQNLPPIIAITANAMTGDKEKYLNEGFDGYITKPLTMKKLFSELHETGFVKKPARN